jgi:hypothetical protein
LPAFLQFTPDQLIALLVAISFAAGVNVYATMGTLGLLAHFHALLLPPGLHLLSNWGIIAVSIVLFAVEFFADKVPMFDLLWNALHTFIRVPLAALLAYGASSQLSSGKQLAATLLGGAIAFAAHGGKLAVRGAVTPSPEPLSNIGLSLTEDAGAIFLTWFATQHPYLAAALVCALLLLLIFTVRWVVRSLRRFFRKASALGEASLHSSP